MSFKSFWGDLDVPEESIKDVEKSEKEGEAGKPVDVSKAVTGDIKVKTDEFELQTGSKNPKEEEDKSAAETGGEGKDPKAEAGDQGKGGNEVSEEGYEFSEEDISKAYTMLEEEGVLEIGEDDEFEATTKGLGDVIASTIRTRVNETIDRLPSEVKELYMHLQKGEDASTFKPSKSIKIADLDVEDEGTHKEILTKFYANQGMTPEEIEEEIGDLETLEKLESKAKTAHKALVRLEESNDEKNAKALAQQEKDNAKNRADEIQGIKDSIDTIQELAGFPLDEEKRANFKKYLFDVNPRTNKTQMQENMNNEDRRMTLAFLDFVNYTKADLDKEVATQLTKKRKKKLVKFTDKNVANKNNSRSVTEPKKNTGKVVFPSIFGTQTIEVED